MSASRSGAAATARAVVATSDRRTTAALILASAIALAAYFLPFPPVPRAAVELSFLLVCPGLALVRILRLPSRLAVASLAVALSLVLDQVVAMVAMYAGGWSPGAALVALAVLTVAAALAPHPSPRHLRVRT
ncbi:hypothetical protein KZX45_02460 [Georgenia sp. EYE_87]|uniref:hypothetical protein n=1 Tax=Georgenia sp. EYE_87 TaxID=2853448 RepID=UPI0020067270|nr:hypothetical protein [Georgenia sp. EYE_87]MCK6209402.1 hypothetical protein [Georgenia sp. EYE_87]